MEKKTSGEVGPFHGYLPEEVAQAIDRADDEQIIQRLTQPELQSCFAYSIPFKLKDGSGTKDVIGISADGAFEIARERGNIKAQSDIKVEDRDGYIYAVVPVTDLSRNFTVLGVGRCSKFIVGEGWIQTDKIDETAFVKAVTKAQRNGILEITPATLIQAIMARLDTRLIKKLAAPRGTKPPERLAPATATAPAAAAGAMGQGETKALTEGAKEKAKDPLSEEKRVLVTDLRALGKTDPEIRESFNYITGKKGGWTKDDLAKIRDIVNQLKAKAPAEAAAAEADADKFLKELE
jgi:hypothetical protein